MMDKVSDLRFSLSEDENIIACDKKDKFSYYTIVFLSCFALIFFAFCCVVSIYSLIKIGIDKDAVFCALTSSLFSIFLFFSFVIQRNSYKFNKIYLTNKRFIIVTRNNIESIEFSNLKNFYYYRRAATFIIDTNDKKRFRFFCLNPFELIENFNKIYPEYNKEKKSPNNAILFLLLAFIALIFYFALEKSDKQKENVQCQFKNTDEYMQYIEKSIKTNWNPPKGIKYNNARVVVRFNILKSGEITDIFLLKGINDTRMDNSAINALANTKLQCGLPSFLNHQKVPVEFTFDYYVKNLNTK